MAKIFGLAPGSKLSISPGAGYQVPATVAGVYRSLVSPTPPPAWCAAGELLRPGLEPPAPMILMDESTMESMGGLDPYGPGRTTFIVAPRATGMTLARAERLNDQLPA
jgi:hypothetical protein